MDRIRAYYEGQPEREWGRLERHRMEYAVTLRLLEEHLPPPPATVLDCGGGPGRYALDLTQQGYEVTLFDLTPGFLEEARIRAEQAGLTLAAYEQGTATDLSRFPDDHFDAVLLMGPLYHLLEQEERLQALREARRVVRPGGPIFAAFISRYAAHLDCIAHYPERLFETPEVYAQILDQGKHAPELSAEGSFMGYLVHPTEVAPLCREAGLELEALVGVEGLVSGHETAVNALEREAWERWVEVNLRIARDPTVHGTVSHLLAVARQPLWRALLPALARRLNGTGIDYRLVGGTAVALHGVPVTTGDLDMEMSQEDAYRVPALLEAYFEAQTLLPVALREKEIYRSHFGRFEVEGVLVEVMGGSARREGERWVPTTAATVTTIDVEGVPVRVSWLEEETLAYVRRGRLDRAGLCLPHCDQGRLLALIRGERATNVL